MSVKLRVDLSENYLEEEALEGVGGGGEEGGRGGGGGGEEGGRGGEGGAADQWRGLGRKDIWG